MTITLKLPPDLEARLLAEANERGLPVDEIVKGYLYHLRAPEPPRRLSAREVDQGFEEAADLIPEGVPPLSNEAMSRESIYTREDDWCPASAGNGGERSAVKITERTREKTTEALHRRREGGHLEAPFAGAGSGLKAV